MEFKKKFIKKRLLNPEIQDILLNTVQLKQGLVLVSTGVLQLVKLSAGDASNRKLNINAEDNLAYAA